MSRMSDLRIEFINMTVDALVKLFHDLPGVEYIEFESCDDEGLLILVERNASDEYYYIDLDELFKMLEEDRVYDSDDFAEWLTEKFKDVQQAIEAGTTEMQNGFIHRAKYIKNYFMKKRQARTKAMGVQSPSEHLPKAKQKKETPPKRSYREVMEDLQKATTPKEYRAVHRELKRDHNERLFLFQRYPYLPIIVSSGALIFSIIAFILKLIR